MSQRPPILTPVYGVEKLLQLLGGQDPICKVSVELLKWQFTIIWNTGGTQNSIITIQSCTQSKTFKDLIAAWLFQRRADCCGRQRAERQQQQRLCCHLRRSAASWANCRSVLAWVTYCTSDRSQLAREEALNAFDRLKQITSCGAITNMGEKCLFFLHSAAPAKS